MKKERWPSKHLETKCRFTPICIIILLSVSRKIIKTLSWLVNYYWTNQRKHNSICLKHHAMSSQLHLYSYIYAVHTISNIFYGQFISLFFENEKMDKCHCLAFVHQSVKLCSSQKRLQWQLSFNMSVLTNC